MFQIGPYTIDHPVILAPMAGVTDKPFRALCRRLGAGLVISEMVTSDTSLWHSQKSRKRLDHQGEVGPIVVQIAGGDPLTMANAARLNVDNGAQIIDINMGCPAKKVCKKAAGSALLKDEKLVENILRTVTSAVNVPVTLKIRTGWDTENRNAVRIAKIAQDCGIAALAIHGRTKACKFDGQAEYDTIAEVVQQASMPIFCNGDITTAVQARRVLDYTGAAAVMIGRAAQGRPWIFREINHYLQTGTELPELSLTEIGEILYTHLRELTEFYGDFLGPRIARKHLGWYLKTIPNSEAFRKYFNRLEHAEEQLLSVQSYFKQLIEKKEQAA